MLNIVTYRASENVKPEYQWIAYIVLSNGDYLGVMFRDYSEAAVKAKAAQFWETESKKRYITQMGDDDDEIEVKTVISESNGTHHLLGKVWMINEATREKRRVLPEQVEALGPGWVKGGPRSR